jgi:iron complex outermembrane receptor protein
MESADMSEEERMRINSIGIFLSVAAASLAWCADPPVLPDFGALSLDELANIKITSFTGKQQKLSQVAGSVYVITQEQIARSGLTSVPELLRLAPGIDVARVNGNQWSVSARGSVGAYANKLLVLIDGRSVYSPIFSGVYWEIGMPLPDDIDRIEVIRGPGATIWGANAVLGVINIITRSSKDTHGTMVTAGGGSSEPGFGSVRTGGVAGPVSYRGYVGGSDQSPLATASGGNANDGMSSLQGGFRLDGTHKKDTWTLEGDLFRGEENNTGVAVSPTTLSIVDSPAHFDTVAGNLTGEWRRRIGENGEFRLKSYFDYANRPQPQASKVATSTWDTDLQYDFKAGRVHNLSVGAGDRLISDDVVTGPGLDFSQPKLTYSNLNAFAQDEMHFANDALLLTAGAKLESNHFSGWGYEPSANLLWTPRKHHSLWISAARSLRTPSLFDVAADGPFTIAAASAATEGLTVLLSFAASPQFSTETVKDFEIGYREQIAKTFSADITAFYDEYSDIRSATGTVPVFAPTPVPHLNVTVFTTNYTEATGKGAEGSLAWQVLKAWKLEGSYTYNAFNPWLDSNAPPTSDFASLKVPARNKWRLQSYVNLSKSWKLDTFLYWTSAGDPVNNYGSAILVPAYTRLDIRLGYKVSSHWQLSLGGQNLLQARHLEAVAELLSAQSYVTRSIYLKSTWRF